MIRSAKVTSGYAAMLPGLTGRTFTFAEGLNVLFGPNACGKTSLLDVVAAHVGCSRPGWSTAVPDHATPSQQRSALPYVDWLAKVAPGECRAEVIWDGTPCLRHRLEVQTAHFEETNADFEEQLGVIFGKPSAGQVILSRLVKLREILAHPPDLLDRKRPWQIGGQTFDYTGVNSTWRGYIDAFIVHVTSLGPSSGRLTLFLDEPDRSLSIPNQADLWRLVLPDIARQAQVLVASHSLFALVTPNVNVIDLEDGYSSQCRKIFEELPGLGRHPSDK